MELWLSEDNFDSVQTFTASYTRILKLDKVSKQLQLFILRQQSTQIKPTPPCLASQSSVEE